MAPSGGVALVAEQVSVCYGQTSALERASIAVGPGESVAVVGPSGSGKTTLLHSLCGILEPVAGRVLLGDLDVYSLRHRDRTILRRTRLGLVLQSGQLIPELSVLDNVALPLLLDRQARKTARLVARAVLEELGVDDVAGRRPDEVSGGQAQRAAVARALVTSPDFVLADEPTGALDQANGQLVIRMLIEATRHRSAGLIVVTHDQAVARAAERRIGMLDGSVVE